MHVPRLATALTGPLLDLERKMLQSQCEIEAWFRSQWLEHAPPVYGSVDLRNSGYKLAPVDMNLFPGGFNNLNPDFTPLCVQAVQSALEKICPDARKLLLIPENHTRNQYYLQNVAALARILKLAGLNVRLGSLNPEITEPTSFALPNGANLTLEPVQRNGRRVGLPGFDPCVVLLNNDLSAGIPPILRGIDQALLPPLHAGWCVRRKTHHFREYDGVAAEFADLLGIDPWYINPYFGQVSGLDFQTREGEERLAAEVERILGLTAAKYRDLGIDAEPYAIVKADAGTYGMGVMSVKSAEEVIGLNRKQRNKMAVVKEGLEVSDVIVQEGVPTFETIEDAVAETGGVHDRPLCCGRLLPRAYRTRCRRKPQRAGRLLPAAGVRYPADYPRLRRQPRLCAEPFLRLWRGRPPGAAGGIARAGDDRVGACGAESGGLILAIATTIHWPKSPARLC